MTGWVTKSSCSPFCLPSSLWMSISLSVHIYNNFTISPGGIKESQQWPSDTSISLFIQDDVLENWHNNPNLNGWCKRGFWLLVSKREQDPPSPWKQLDTVTWQMPSYWKTIYFPNQSIHVLQTVIPLAPWYKTVCEVLQGYRFSLVRIWMESTLYSSKNFNQSPAPPPPFSFGSWGF